MDSTNEADLALVYNIIDTLKQLQLAHSSLIHDNDSLDVSIDTLITAFNIDIKDTSRLLSNTSLRELLITAQQQQSNPPHPAAPRLSTDNNKKWRDTLNKLHESNYFSDYLPGTSEYNQRYQKAKLVFETKYNCTIDGDNTHTPATTDAPPPSESSQSVSDSDRRQADACKLEGNKSLTAGAYQDAIDMYSAAISLNPYNAIYYSNRAAAYISLHKYSKAIDDCVEAIKYDSSYGKAYYRKGQAELKLNQFNNAIESFEAAARLMPDDTAVQQQLQLVKQRGHSGSSSIGGDDTYDIDTTQQNNMNRPSSSSGAAPDFSSLLNNPALAGLDMNSLDFGALMNNPAIMQMAAQMMPGMFGGGGGGSDTSTNNNNSSSATPAGGFDMNSILSNPAIQSLKNDPELRPIFDDIQANGSGAISKYMNNPKLMQKLSGIMGNFGGQ